MKKKFEVGKMYSVLENDGTGSWSHNLKCISRSDDIIEFDEIDEQDNMCANFRLFVKEKFTLHDSVEYCEIGFGCIVQAD
jgi:hypothetical protein